MRIKAQEASVVQVDMTPMIDIVFLLIAFFMVISNFEQTEVDERVKLPRDSLARPPLVARQKELLLNIGFHRDEQGKKTNPNPIVFYSGDPIPALDMGPVLDRERRLFIDLGTDPTEVTVVIRADAEVPTGVVQKMIELAQEATFEKFALKALQKIDQ